MMSLFRLRLHRERKGDWRPPFGTPHGVSCRAYDPPGRKHRKVEIADAISSSHRTCRCCGLYARVCPLAAPPGTSSAALPSHRPTGFGLRPHPPGEPADSGIPCRRGQVGTPLGFGTERLWDGDDGSACGPRFLRGLLNMPLAMGCLADDILCSAFESTFLGMAAAVRFSRLYSAALSHWALGFCVLGMVEEDCLVK